ncbi:MAG: hypothetical protein AB1Z51_13790 [Desulfuromonadales bacterium]
MALVLCPECGEETLDRLTNCPLCEEPLAEEKQQIRDTTKLFIYGALFLGGLTGATLCNSLGYTRTAISLAILGVLSMVVMILKLGKS